MQFEKARGTAWTTLQRLVKPLLLRPDRGVGWLQVMAGPDVDDVSTRQYLAARVQGQVHTAGWRIGRPDRKVEQSKEGSRWQLREVRW